MKKGNSNLFLAVLITVVSWEGMVFGFAGGDGSEGNPWQISNATHLQAVNNDLYAHYILVNDIYLGSYTYAVIAPDLGASSPHFKGSFDGNGHFIRNLTVSGGESFYGLFGICDSGSEIKNLYMENISINGWLYVGCLVGYNNGSITNCHIIGDIYGPSNEYTDVDFVGGLVGYNSSLGNITHCSSAGTITCPLRSMFNNNEYVGGLVGYNYYGSITNCHSTMNITASAFGGDNVGGLVGQNYHGTITSCYATGDVTGNAYVGGLIGQNVGANISLCYSTGMVTGRAETYGGSNYAEYIGGLVGINNGNITDCYSKGYASGDRFVGGLIGQNYNGGHVTNCYSTGYVLGAGGPSIAALVGYNQDSYITSCFWDKYTSYSNTGCNTNVPSQVVDVFGKTTTEMQTQLTFTDYGWDFLGETINGTDEIWQMPIAGGYPELTYTRPVVFQDLNLKDVVEQTIGVTDPWPCDMLKLKSLYADDLNISSLEGLQYVKNLEYFWAGYNQISDITPIGGLTKIWFLDLDYNNIHDISILHNLSNLEQLYLDGNKISDISALTNLIEIEWLTLSRNQISDVSPLTNLVKLRHLMLNINQINNIIPLSGLINLEHLGIQSNSIGQISVLSNFHLLTELNLGGNQINDIAPLSELINLTSLVLSSNQISELSGLSELVNLESLYLESNPINDISFLSDLVKLKSLNLDNTSVNDISALSGVVNLNRLDLMNNQIDDISSLSGLANLETLNLFNNQISDISPIGNITNIQYLFLPMNPIIDIHALTNLKNLKQLYLRYTNLNSNAYCFDIPRIIENNPDVVLLYDENLNQISNDCSTCIPELLQFSSNWLLDNCNKSNDWCEWSDLNKNNSIDIEDLSIFAQMWLMD